MCTVTPACRYASSISPYWARATWKSNFKPTRSERSATALPARQEKLSIGPTSTSRSVPYSLSTPQRSSRSVPPAACRVVSGVTGFTMSGRVRNAIDDSAAVLAHQQRSVRKLGRGDGPSPHRVVVDDESGQEILVVAARRVVLHVHARQLVAGSQAAVPGPVECCEGIADVLGRERRFARGRDVKREVQRRRMRLVEHVRHQHVTVQTGRLVFGPGILMGAYVVPGPAIKSARRQAGGIVGHQII